MEKGNSENFIRTVLRSEITWAVCLIGGVTSFFTMVVLPIQKLQIQISQVQDQIMSESNSFKDMSLSLQQVSSKQQVDESQINQIKEQISRIFPSVK